MLRQFTDDFKEEITEKESVRYRKQFHILLINNLLFNHLLFKGSKSGKPNKICLEAWPIRGGWGVLGAVTKKNCVVRDERGLGEGWIGVRFPEEVRSHYE